MTAIGDAIEKEDPIDPTHSTDSSRVSPEETLRAIVETLEDRQAQEIFTINLAGKSSIADFMVIASGRSNRQVIALAENVIEALKKLGIKGLHPEGMGQGDWVLIDAGDVIVHLFRPEVRDFYNLEKMWDVTLHESDRSTGAGG